MSFNVVKSRGAKPNQVLTRSKAYNLPKSHQLLGRKRFHPIVAKFLHFQSSNFQVNHIPLMINAISAMEGDIRRTEAET